MNIRKIDEMFRGWFIGNFEPSIVNTESFEVALLTHHKNEVWPKHYHKLADEVNVLISGKMTVNGIELHPGDILHVEKNEIVEPIFLEDCKLICVKFPSVLGDKYEVKDDLG